MVNLVFGLGVVLLVIMGVGLASICLWLRELVRALQSHREAVLTSSLGICRRLDLLNDNTVEIAKHLDENKADIP